MDPKRLSNYRTENHAICNLCNVQLNQDVITHMTDKHCASYFYKCHLCRNYDGCVKSGLFQHQKDKHDVSYYYIACPICMQFFSPEERAVKEHLVTVHSRMEMAYVCNYCSFSSKLKLDDHFDTIHSRYVCVFVNCKAVCQNETHLFQHYMGHHFPKLTLFYSCSECDVMFPQENSLYQHKRDKHGIEEEEEEETFIELNCPMCSFTTCNLEAYEQHSINKHPDNFFNCTFQNCNYQTKLFRSITQHTIDKHLLSTLLWYNCFVCEVSFTKIHSLIQHLRDKHSVDRFCSLCNSYEEDLSNHILDDPDHSYDVFSCEICDEQYDEKHELVDHISDNHVNITPLLRSLCFGD